MPTHSLECVFHVAVQLGYEEHQRDGGLVLFVSHAVEGVVSDLLVVGMDSDGDGQYRVDESLLIRLFENNGNARAAILAAITEATGGS